MGRGMHPAVKAQQKKMKACAAKAPRGKKYRKFMKKCL